MQRTKPNHYAVLGLDRTCSTEQIRAAYRLLAKQLHPDVNGAASHAGVQMSELNAAHEILADPERRRAYDAEFTSGPKRPRPATRKLSLTQVMFLRLEELLRGATLEVRVNDPCNPAGAEVYSLKIPPGTVPGTRLKLDRDDGSHVFVRVRARPDHRFKLRGSDLRCDLRISTQRAARGGVEFVQGPCGTRMSVNIPHGISRGEVIRVLGAGLPKPRGGRGDLLVRIIYRPEVRIARASRR